jgi:hypothetical protein
MTHFDHFHISIFRTMYQIFNLQQLWEQVNKLMEFIIFIKSKK